MNWSEAGKLYLEIGILGLCAVFTILSAWLSFKRSHDKDDEKDKRIDKKDDSIEAKFDAMIKMLQAQNQEYAEQQAKNTELLIQSIIHGVTSHTITPEENQKLTKISEELDKNLQQILIATNASRVSLVQYHNGGKGINRQSFLKMSMTNEQVQLGVKPFIQDFKDQFRSVLAYFIKEINNTGKCYINDLEDIREVDICMYEFLLDRGIQAKYGLAIRDTNKHVIGFICIEYEDKSKVNLGAINNMFDDRQAVFETLLSL